MFSDLPKHDCGSQAELKRKTSYDVVWGRVGWAGRKDVAPSTGVFFGRGGQGDHSALRP